ncbi:hypothetical protein N7470_007303 [Penicillium chermesinum]|nr:hypothetical protein N7470_007303 [Penicillium chermesinum]
MAGNSLRNIIVIGGSFIGTNTARELARVLPSTHRVLLTEAHSHFHHLFTFPRFAVIPSYEHKAFIPYTSIFSDVPNPTTHAVVQARVTSVQRQHIELDRDWQGSKQIPYDFVVLATGTRLSKPAAMEKDDKLSSVTYLQQHQEQIQRASKILLHITLVQSRARVMPNFHPRLHELIKGRFEELGIKLITDTRVQIPPGGFPQDGSAFDVKLTNGTTESTEFVILATGQTPNNQLVAHLASSPNAPSVINPDNGYLRVRPTLQLLDEQYSNIFAVGDIADTGNQKAARPASSHASVVANNIRALIENREPEETFVKAPAGIHLTLGKSYNIKFRNPNPEAGQPEPWISESHNGREDMNVEAMWQRLEVNVDAEDPRQYHL